MKGGFVMRSNSFLSKLHLLFAVLASTAVTGSSFAQPQRVADVTALVKQHAVWNPGEFILSKLKTNRIVMVGDAGHGDPLYSRVVINSLNDWVSEWAQVGSDRKPEKLPSKLFLILEMDSVQANGLGQYFVNGDPALTLKPFNFIGNQFTTGVLQFYNELRLIKERVAAFNEGRTERSQISLDVVGPEKVMDPVGWTPAKRDSFFVYGRDEYSSSKIRDLLEKAPEAKALLYYGQSHLYAEKTRKLEGNSQSMGYYLGHYLMQDFASNGGVYAVEQIDAEAIPARLDKAISEIGKTFAIDDSVFKGAAVGPNAYIPWLDGSIFYFTPPRNTRHLSMLYSETLVDYVLKNIDSYRNVSEESNRWVIGSWLYYLSNVAVVPLHGLDYKDSAAVDSAIDAWKQWRRSTDVDMVRDIASLKYFKRYIDLIRSTTDPESLQYEKSIASLVGFRVWFPMGTSSQVRADSTWSYINKYRSSIVVENLIDLLWVASKSEKEEAISVLGKETGMNFKSAEDWSTWWEAQQAK